jgi:predicted amidohydrolase
MTIKNPRIALAQIKYFDLHDKNNVEKIIKYIQLAKKGGADIVCFPETCVLKEKHLDLKHDFLNQIREECKKNEIWCIITDDFMYKEKLYNMSVLIDRNGKIKGNYKKMRPYAERNVTAGNKIKVFDTDFGKIGIAICWDLAFPKLFKSMKKSGAHIIFCPAQWAYEEKAHENKHNIRELDLLKSLLQSRAFENLSYLAFCSPCRTDQKDMICYSAIISPHKIMEEIHNEEGLIFSDLEMKDINKFKKLYPGKEELFPKK